MTFEDLKKYARKKGLEVDNAIHIKNYTLYELGYIWLNINIHSEACMAVSFLLVEDRTPEQMKKFIESLL